MATNCTGERRFSKHKMIDNYLNLEILSLESKILNYIETVDIINSFSNRL